MKESKSNHRSRSIYLTRTIFSPLTISTILGPWLVCCGCSDKPKAPPLLNETVYNYEKIGLRFLSPEGWTIASRSTIPPGPLSKPLLLATYRGTGEEHPAALEVFAVDLAEDADFGLYLLDHSIGVGQWTLKNPATAATINSAPATHYLLSQKEGTVEHLRDVTAFRRGGRVYFFMISYGADDPGSSDPARKSIDSITWTK